MATVKELEQKLNDQADVIGTLFDKVAELEARIAEQCRVINVIGGQVTELRYPYGAPRPFPKEVLDKDARIAAIKRLHAKYQDARSFSYEQVAAEIASAA